MTHENDLETLLPITEKVIVFAGTAKEEEVIVSPIKYKQFTAVTKHIIALRVTIAQSITAHVAAGGNQIKELDELPVDFLELIGTNGEDIGEIIRISISKPASWMDDLDLPDVLRLAVAVIKVNKDFFFQRLAPVMKQLVAGLKK